LAAGCGSSAAKVETPAPAMQTFAGGELTPPRAAPPVSLHDASGRRFTLSAQRGRYVLVTFIYTHCPDVCPLITSNLNTVLRTLGPKANIDVLAVSVDPKGDTASAVATFVRSHRLRPQFHYLTGSTKALERVWRLYNVSSVRRGGAGVDHTLYTLVLDRSGRTRVLFDSLAKPAAMVHDVRLLLS